MRLTHPALPDALVTTYDEAYARVLQTVGWEHAPALPEVGNVAEATVDQVLAQVGDDPERAALALEEERSGKGRTTLIAALEQIVADRSGE